MVHPEALTEGIPDTLAVERYTRVLSRLAMPYAVDQQRRASLSQYTATTLTPAGGLVSTVRDLAKFHLALKDGILLRPDTLALAWQAPVDRDGRRLPHGLGWFVQSYNGVPVIWQFGTVPDAFSSLMLKVPTRGLTLILLANSDGLSPPLLALEKSGDVTASVFARTFLRMYVP